MRSIHLTKLGGNVAHVVQHTGASGPLDKIWSKDVGEGSGRKGRVIATPVIANGVIYTVDARYNVVATEEATGNKLWNFKLAAIERESTREGKTSFIDRIKDPLTFTDGDGTDKEGIGGGIAFSNAPFSSGELIALRVQNGGVLWQDALSSTARLTPLASLNDMVRSIGSSNSKPIKMRKSVKSARFGQVHCSQAAVC